MIIFSGGRRLPLATSAMLLNTYYFHFLTISTFYYFHFLTISTFLLFPLSYYFLLFPLSLETWHSIKSRVIVQILCRSCFSARDLSSQIADLFLLVVHHPLQFGLGLLCLTIVLVVKPGMTQHLLLMNIYFEITRNSLALNNIGYKKSLAKHFSSRPRVN